MTAIQELDLPLLLPEGAECERCVNRLSTALSQIHGVHSASVCREASKLHIAYDPNTLSLSNIETEARRAGATITAEMEHFSLEMKGLDCPDCAGAIEKSVRRQPGVVWANANFATGLLSVECERRGACLPRILKTVGKHGVAACPLNNSDAGVNVDAKDDVAWIRRNGKACVVALSVVFTIAGWVANILGIAALSGTLYLLAVATGGWSILRGSWSGFRAGTFDMNGLMTVAIIGALGIGDRFEAATVVALFGVGNLLQSLTMQRTRSSIRSLMSLSPATARVVRNDRETAVPVEDVQIGDSLLVLPGERIPMDGLITSGATTVNESPITGESLPVEKMVGDEVCAGTLNGSGAFEFQVNRRYRDTLLARIIHRVEEAQTQRAPVQQFIDRFARIYTPVVVGLAVIVAVAPPLIHALAHGGYVGAFWREWFMRALALLIVACPCALVISTPVAIVSAIGNASRRGVLVKGGACLEALSGLRAMLYDKTGTLTLGSFRIQETIPLDNLSQREVLAVAAGLESKSGHPLAPAFLMEAEKRGVAVPNVVEFKAEAGRGLAGVVDGKSCLLGNRKHLSAHRVEFNGAIALIHEQEARGRTIAVLAVEGKPAALFALADTPRANTNTIMKQMEAEGIQHQAMLTGDNRLASRGVADTVGLADVCAELLPEEKQRLIAEYRARFGKVGMVGDGVNDTPALASADVGIVMGAAGSDTAIETADVVLMSDDLSRLPGMIRLGRRMNFVIRQNVGFALVAKALLVTAALTTGLPLWLAVLGDVGVSLLVTLNSLRLMGGA